MRLALILAAMAALAGCTAFPEVEARTSRADEPAPPLLPLDELLARAGTPTVTPETQASLEARAAALRARAASLQSAPAEP
ncbi:hypothetical protein GQF56_05090 [Rhodobacter sphaeroides]|jgi:hypothetical protein|uniref:DUF3035 domain-containing protein n=1 Tax=Cereibacter sphaeroides (strain ATCC 17023 / DSM 158 / JCM 6121 / CCUG 31486 / LMG 2827 / NBRC 12203 / NCIMB 8253 / ATH 2.4.1.) TaxID=272943 RepID=U5NMV8_CERS4|nr:hypothetical protein [Cereibacter sphaeroides]EKX56244.1 hypothetical protein D516_3017 [Rhodobacter sp. AKP1]AGY32433.1 hypothetical protein RSP_7558 [Cereibacter sphaeroides 2.4.1]AMJ47866.1 hypothetical protein APX01_10030 [Cereibacter sphaeroides]ANS34575.1 hypothetical protein A3858_10055 [Cereibacter sphaeroides]ATN63623.1 hypothetical protein A3857_10050 [Cereibacter sphaeroides]